jgi:hypothetical protein
MGVEQYTGPGGITVQLVGDHNTVTVSTATARLTLALKHHLNARPALTDRELLLTEGRDITLVGRDGELEWLEAWPASEDDISVRCLTETVSNLGGHAALRKGRRAHLSATA